MASILGSPSDCCQVCCPVQIVDLPSGGGGQGVNAYENVAALRNETSVKILVDDSFATVYGLFARGDGLGGGSWYYDSSNLDADDGISIVIPNSIVRPAPGAWKKFIG